MGRYLPTLGPAFADAAQVAPGQHALDVGCGPGGLTGELVARLGPDAVCAIDPSPPFVAACRARHPGVDVRIGAAEHLPYADNTFDVTLASLVVGFMSDPEASIAEMARVTMSGGTVAICFWDGRRMPMLDIYWDAATAHGCSSLGPSLRGSREGELAALLRHAGLAEIRESVLTASARYTDFDDWWHAFTFGVGPVGQHYETLSQRDRSRLRAACLNSLDYPDTAFTLTAHAWCAVGSVDERH